MATNDLVTNIGNLMEWNMINYNEANSLNADENAMAAALNKPDRFKLVDRCTDFKITTTVDLRMLFLSMSFAQDGINGIVPPKTLEIISTDYRGY